ncbi:MAG: hypothetical protein A3I07_03095 [Candidatus Doudnabacteria bacterium RIFCSPLOWO2_02_FULL_42_9]|uniref:SpoVT-AbrB domain-containing protein n=1 Tax=Candidatus Doudnabacteria bacterium RIFCSPHIGHO2_01_FULL_41_86 TaxID=1817821 RepID=A0A1F5N965_9BACT|nr:MAG: hypothetical protein A2717_01515 [Candidatus Doudnabacteria bacterium RIFCSPHIGHO2_01_FULL_41_86]OGE75047.1 MAG: hypothetical protein A3K07_04735 [Candidatus Doudnabacteria bacterium RIFCSPHIGHO2_01_43_10]OGE85246.1 MAG: hypothetical protein A3E28_01085 [Candidatus Doudnabacteria bacterium RIFCSPHIGHO2_12_FULL_42_22]OGE86784.1 MAG: hypothetical protein A3C49_01920 [Candidatus Doudnabacteria bacterium RIFCSPHIGHO2_02_FULL_42_25]OGE92383.1 MAG: hypothetical protein A2895_02075 [Candidatus
MAKNSNIKKVTRIGKGSLGIMLPASGVRSLGWRERQRVIVKRIPRGFMILDAVTKKRKR